MFDFLKRNKTATTPEQNYTISEASEAIPTGLFDRLKRGLKKTRLGFTSGLANLILGKKTIDEEMLQSIEEILLQADVGVATCQKIVSDLTAQVARKDLRDPN